MPTGSQLAPSLSVVSVAGIPAPLNPQGLFSPPDVTINSAVEVPIVIEGQNIPPNTQVTVQIYNETLGAQTLQSPPLQGTLEQSTTTLNTTIPPGFSGIVLDARWTP